MKIILKNLRFLKSVFARLMISFLLVILIVSSFSFLSYKFYIKNIETEMINNTSERLESLSNKFDSYIEKIRSMFLNIYIEDNFQYILKSDHSSSYSDKLVVDMLKSYGNKIPYLKSICILSEKSDYVLTSLGTYDKTKFFTTFYNNDIYNKEFWTKELNKDSNFYIYGISEFRDYSDPNQTSVYYLVPIMFKSVRNSDFLMLALIDSQNLVLSLERNFIDNFYINTHEGDSLYPALESESIARGILEESQNIMRVRNGYLLRHHSNIGNISYVKFISNVFLKKQLVRNNSIFAWIIIASFLISFMVSTYIAKRFNTLVKKIMEVIKKSENSTNNQIDTNELQYIQNNIQRIVAQNANYTEELHRKDSMLETFFYQTKIKDIYLQISELMEQFTIKNNYCLLCFKLHYRQAYFDQICKESNKGTFFIKELIQIYLKEYFQDTITFQPENNEIISLIQMRDRKNNPIPFIREIINKLKQEEEYVFFTIVASNTNTDISELDRVYNKIIEISRYRDLEEHTQFLVEDNFNIKCDQFYFSLRQAESLTKLLCEGKAGPCIEEINTIIEYNLKMGVNNFYMNLLCTEFINCSINVINHLYQQLPHSINIQDIYSRLNQCYTIQQHKILLENFICFITDYIDRYKVEKDYIVDYVKEYIESHYQEDIYLDLLADKLNITKEYLSSYFKNKTGINLSEFMKEFRMKKAISLLETTSDKIQDIAAQVGFGNTNTFIRSFKKYTGKTPKEYRQSAVQ